MSKKVKVNKKRAEELLVPIVQFLDTEPEITPDTPDGLFRWQTFFNNTVTFLNMFITWPPVVDARVCSLAQRIALYIRRTNLRYSDAFSIELPTDNRVSTSESLMHALARALVVGCEPTWIRTASHFTSCDPSILQYDLSQCTVPILRMPLSDIEAHMLELSKRWKTLEYSPALVFYVQMLEAAVMRMIARPQTAFICDDSRFSVFAEGISVNMTMADVQKSVEEAEKRRLEREKAKYITSNIARSKPSEIAAALQILQRDENDTTAVSFKPKVTVTHTVDAHGREIMETKIDKPSGNKYAKHSHSSLVASARKRVEDSVRGGDPLEIENATNAWKLVTQTEFSAYDYIARAREAAAANAEQKGEDLASKILSTECVRDMYTMFTEMNIDIVNHERFPESHHISSYDELAQSFSNDVVQFSSEAMKIAYAYTKSGLESFIGVLQSNHRGDEVADLYFEQALYVGERKRKRRHDRDADADPHAIIYNSRPDKFNVISERAQEKIAVVFNHPETPPLTHDHILVMAFDALFRKETSSSFIDTFVYDSNNLHAQDARLRYPVFVETFNRIRVCDSGVLLTFEDSVLMYMYWMLRIMFDIQFMGTVMDVDVTNVFIAIMKNLAPVYSEFQNKMAKRK